MLGKLIKHELRAMLSKSTLIGVIFLIVAVLIRILTLFEDAIESIPSVMVSFIFLVFIFVFGLVGLNFYALFISVSRFQKNLFGDEGYLMHTLPVPSYYHIITKFVSGLVMWILANAVSVISVVIAFLGVEDLVSIADTINKLFKVIAEYPLQAFMIFITTISSYCALIFLCYLCVSITNFVSKGKGAINALLVIGALIVNNIITTMIMEFLSRSEINSEIIVYLIYTVYFGIVAAIFFFITNRIISRNLNLE